MPALLTLNVPDQATADRIVTALCAVNGYQDTVPDPANIGQTIPNPQTRQQFAKAQVMQFLRQTVVNYERSQAAAPTDPVLT